MLNFKDKIILITGSASGIGKATSIHFAKLGAVIACVDIDSEKNKLLCDEIKSFSGTAYSFIGDVSNADDCEMIVNNIKNKLKKVDILFNNAGIIRRSDVLNSSESEWDLVLNVNLKSVFLLSKLIIPLMIENGGGNVINTASGWGINGGTNAASYCASKGGVILLTKSMALDYGKHNIRVNAICPGDTDTNMLMGEADQLNIPYSEIISAGEKRPLQRIGRPDEIANVVEFLASTKSSYVTGSVYVVDGGSLAGSD